MPIRSKTNNQLIPTNRRSVDVAKSTIDRLLPHQNLRYDSAFQVQGFQCVLYSKLTHGKACLCKSKNKKLSTVLDEEGNANPGVLNTLLTGQDFGLLPYGVKPSQPLQAETFVISTGGPAADLALPSIYERDSGSIAPVKTGAPGENYQSSSNYQKGNDVSDGFGDAGPVFNDEEESALDKLNLLASDNFDSFSFGLTDVACPICFGTGIVGGFSVYNGLRLVLDSQALSSAVTVYHEEFVPLIEPEQGSLVEFQPVVLPFAFSIDSFRVFNGRETVKARLYANGNLLASEHELIRYCNGKPVVLSIQLLTDKQAHNSSEVFTHVEIQINQSAKSALFEFPKLSQSEAETFIERTDPFQLVLPPSLPNIKNGDIIVDSTYSKVLQVTSSNWWNDKRRAVLGWECNVRPTQPQEVYSILPKRRAVQSQNSVVVNRPNITKKF